MEVAEEEKVVSAMQRSTVVGLARSRPACRMYTSRVASLKTQRVSHRRGVTSLLLPRALD